MTPLCYLQTAARLWRVRRDLASLGFEGARRRWLLPVTGDARAPALAWARCLRRIGTRWPGSRCLDQSLTLASLLRERGVAAILVIGAERQGAQWMHHAWVEVDGAALAEAESVSRFQILQRWPDGGP
ncbi:MAG: lasso peptide biosynthesis B2 protein [Lysobacterales bacterium]